MRISFTTIVFLFAIMLVMGSNMAMDDVVTDKQKVDSLFSDSIAIDSLRLAIEAHNRAVDDSLSADSLNRKRKNGIEAPVTYTAKDSLVYYADTKRAFLFGNSNVKYENMDLTAEKINMRLDSSLVRATGAMDTVKKERYGLPVFLMGSDKYETDTMAFNFKTKKGLVLNTYTEQQDGYLMAERAKRDADGSFYLRRGKYTTCDAEHPDFYLALTRAKVRPGKDVVFGPAYLVVQDVPLPLAIPYGFFPFSKKYSSGFIMPTYGDESERGFYLHNGGYYFAISDQMDLKLLGEIYTKGSWGVSAASNYRVRYKYSGQFFFSYLDSRTGEKGFPDYSKTTSFKLLWSHTQDGKANPYSSLRASVNYASTSYEANNLMSLYNPAARTQSTRTSSISWGTSFSSIGMTLSASTNISQYTRDSTVSLLLPDLNVTISRFYPFKRKEMVGKERWYEKIYLSYTGQLSNSINTKEDQLFKSNLIKDWKNAIQHKVPIGASFSIFKYINVSPTISFTDRMYSDKVLRSWDEQNQKEVRDTVYGFYNVYDWSAAVSMNTKLYGFFVPNRKLFGDKIQAIRHTFTPQVSFSYSPDFSSEHYNFYETYVKTDADGNVSVVKYSPYSDGLFGTAKSGTVGSIRFSIENNIEMKVKTKEDSIKKISIIDQLGANMSYNIAAKTRPWSDLNMNIRLKWWKNYTFSMNATFATYAYDLDENGRPYIGTHTEYSRGRFGRFQGMSQNISYTLNPEKIRKLFGKGTDKNNTEKDAKEDDDTGIETNIDPEMQKAQNGATKKNAGMAETDEDGYLKFAMPWSLTFSYGITMRENTSGTFNKKTMRYPYKFTQTLNFAGNIRLSDGWNITFMSGYDFEEKKLTMTTASLGRDLHCFSMSCSMVIAPYTSYNFSFRCNASTLADALKYDKRSGYSNSIKWY